MKKNIIPNYNFSIKKMTNSWLPYGVSNRYTQINYLKIKEKKFSKEFGDFYLLKIKDELYVSNYESLSYYYAHFKKMCKKHSLDRKLDFLTVLGKSDNNLFKSFEEQPNSEHGTPLQGVCFIRYKTVKKFNWIENVELVEEIDKICN